MPRHGVNKDCGDFNTRRWLLQEWDPGKEREESPHLCEEHAGRLLSRVLAAFREETAFSPRRVAIHKSTPYSDAERSGFENALRGIPEYGLVTINQRGIFCLRPGRKAILRGTAAPFDENVGLVFAS